MPSLSLDRVYTVGGRSFATPDEFGRTLKAAEVDLVLDIRWRRAARGAKFAFLNKRRLEALLDSERIGYLSVRALAPPPTIREAQHTRDALSKQTKYSRSSLDTVFVRRYSHEILDPFDFRALLRRIATRCAKRPALLCLERNPKACHRHLVAERLAAVANCEVSHLGWGV